MHSLNLRMFFDLPYRLILGSNSPRRAEIMEKAGFKFDIWKFETDETVPSGLTMPQQITEYISNNKAQSVQQQLGNSDLLITADTLVFLDGKEYGKPKDLSDAKTMLEDLSGRTHQVCSSVTLSSLNFQITFSDTSLVKFRETDAAIMDYYLQNFKPLDKAGAYGIQDFWGMSMIESIQGSFYTVMGLPIHLLIHELRKLANEKR